jgi:hypothetical protein
MKNDDINTPHEANDETDGHLGDNDATREIPNETPAAAAGRSTPDAAPGSTPGSALETAPGSTSETAPGDDQTKELEQFDATPAVEQPSPKRRFSKKVLIGAGIAVLAVVLIGGTAALAGSGAFSGQQTAATSPTGPGAYDVSPPTGTPTGVPTGTPTGGPTPGAGSATPPKGPGTDGPGVGRPGPGAPAAGAPGPGGPDGGPGRRGKAGPPAGGRAATTPPTGTAPTPPPATR